MNTVDTVTIYDVAREAGVSMATVSRVVNGNKNVKAVSYTHLTLPTTPYV